MISKKKTAQKYIWDSQWKTFNSSAAVFEGRFTQEAYRVIKRFIANEDRHILEAGCGSGRFCILLAEDYPEAEVIGMDISEEALRIAQGLEGTSKSHNPRFDLGDLFQMPYSSNCFDVVFNEGVIEHFSLNGSPTYEDALREMIRVARPGGMVIVAVPNWYCFPHTIYKWLLVGLNGEYEYGYEKSFKHRELVDLFIEFGLRDIELTGWYPAHGFYRLSKYSGMFYILGKLTDLVQSELFARKCGFEILIKGVK